MHLILTGPTGLVGSAVLHHVLSVDTITKITVLSRRPVPMAEGAPKVDVIILKDFSAYSPEILEKLKGAEGCIWAQGVSYPTVTKSEYEKITVEYPLAAANTFSSLSDPFKFVYVSGEGATTHPTTASNNLRPFGAYKGRAEAALLNMAKKSSSFTPYSLRPGGVDSTAHPEIHPFIPQGGMGKKVVNTVVFPILRTFWVNKTSPTRDLARILTQLAMSDGKPLTGEGIEGEGRTITNAGFRRLAGL